MNLHLLLVAAVLLPGLSGPARADSAQTYTRAITTDLDTQQLDEEFDVQPNAASRAAASVGSIDAHGSTDFGVIKLYVDAPATPGHAGLAQAYGSFRDNLTFSGGSTPVPYSLGFIATGSVVNHTPGSGDWAYQATMSLTGEFVNDQANVSLTTSATGKVSIALSLSGVLVPNQPVGLFTYFAIFTSGLEFSDFQLDFSHTALLTGFDLPAGTVVTSEALGVLPTGADGRIDYPAALREIAAVPEPGTAALFALGLGVVLAGSRRVAGRGRARGDRLKPAAPAAP